MKRNNRGFVLALGFVLLASIILGSSVIQEEGEESGKRLGLDEIYDQMRNGVRLILAYHRASYSFIGSIENVTDKTIKRVRVEVHLSNGAELDPSEPKDLEPGEKSGVKIEASGQVFEWWTAHPESGSEKHELPF